MKQTLFLFFLIALVSACGSSNDETQQTTPPAIENELEQSDLTFYISDFISKSGVLKITDLTTNTETSQDVEDIASYSTSLDEQKVYHFEFVPENVRIVCPLKAGCGRSIRNDPVDLNNNDEIDFGEPLVAELSHKAKLVPVAGANKVIFSSFSTLMAERDFANNQLSLTGTPIYHLSHSNQNQS